MILGNLFRLWSTLVWWNDVWSPHFFEKKYNKNAKSRLPCSKNLRIHSGYHFACSCGTHFWTQLGHFLKTLSLIVVLNQCLEGNKHRCNVHVKTEMRKIDFGNISIKIKLFPVLYWTKKGGRLCIKCPSCHLIFLPLISIFFSTVYMYTPHNILTYESTPNSNQIERRYIGPPVT